MSNAFWAGLFLVGLALYLLIDAIRSLKMFEACGHWPKTTGVMTKSLVSRPKSTSSQHVFYAGYDYNVGGRSYSGSRVAYYTVSDEAEAKGLGNSHAVGQTVDVFYDPANPGEATLINQPKADGKKYGEVILGCLALAVGIGVIVFSFR
ncbi:DUF3592 domain-containing protein [Kiloniella sp. EL199]|uniref:DUF3592 domain-containing protein n=1 Tax=Kiloniella sp. EL199 TaxID=2107581 RepID=UPI000EA408FA|nr:DUF3592 domain-containing protein [Kiloniella sp. EL199]